MISKDSTFSTMIILDAIAIVALASMNAMASTNGLGYGYFEGRLQASLCFSMERDPNGCSIDTPVLCCRGADPSSCCRAPDQAWCKCMDAKNLFYQDRHNYDSVIFYRTARGTNPIHDDYYQANMNRQTLTCPETQPPLLECSSRVISTR